MKTLGQISYEAYLTACGGKSLISGALLPIWSDQAENIQQAWEQAGAAANRTVIQSDPIVPPVDRSARVLTDGSPVTEDHREIDPDTGQQKAYVVLSAEERAKGFVRPVRNTYLHIKCGVTTKMGNALAETYARDPGFYTGTFCAICREHFPLDQFVWAGTNEQVGS